MAIAAGYESHCLSCTLCVRNGQEHDGSEVVMGKPLRCRFGWHRWETRYSSDGTSRYLQCRRCPKQNEFELRQWWPAE